MMLIGGTGYIAWYKRHVLNKIELAFQGGYDPALELATFSDGDHVEEAEHFRRKEQDMIDAIIAGRTQGSYYFLLGPKGTGKATMILDAMRKIEAEGVAILDCHPDLEVLRQRLGHAINFKYYEDSQMGLFQRRDPREGGSALDIERALNRLEKVALRYARRNKRPLVLIFSNIHLIRNTDGGRNMLLQLQQRAEAWAESVYSSDDFWPWFAMRRTANRMNAYQALQRLRSTKMKAASESAAEHDRSVYRRVLDITGGQLALLNKLAGAHDMGRAAEDMLIVEREWLESRIGLIEDCAEDQKWSSCSWLLLRELVRLRQEQEDAFKVAQSRGGIDEIADEWLHRLPLPRIPYHRARQIMMRADFIEELDTLNIIALDTHHNVMPDSMLILQAARQVIEGYGFDAKLERVRTRIDEVEGLRCQREIVVRIFALVV
ncbi:hypothetical protein AURDEDRAFT_135079 [Auricularia subglabra TFB-10046 SS5]|nr:hypothetical protein AURDEDRAFT_135079 [Auricularia subglabra TFB-10046 SS5]